MRSLSSVLHGSRPAGCEHRMCCFIGHLLNLFHGPRRPTPFLDKGGSWHPWHLCLVRGHGPAERALEPRQWGTLGSCLTPHTCKPRFCVERRMLGGPSFMRDMSPAAWDRRLTQRALEDWQFTERPGHQRGSKDGGTRCPTPLPALNSAHLSCHWGPGVQLRDAMEMEPEKGRQ